MCELAKRGGEFVESNGAHPCGAAIGRTDIYDHRCAKAQRGVDAERVPRGWRA